MKTNFRNKMVAPLNISADTAQLIAETEQLVREATFILKEFTNEAEKVCDKQTVQHNHNTIN